MEVNLQIDDKNGNLLWISEPDKENEVCITIQNDEQPQSEFFLTRELAQKIREWLDSQISTIEKNEKKQIMENG